MIKFENYTPHPIQMNDGTIYPKVDGRVIRVSNSFTKADENNICNVVYGEVEGLPAPQKDVFLIVSAMVLSASNREDLVAPATGHPDAIRNEKGHIVSVPCFVR